ncbi:MAG: YARHG domain-containing protein [Agathobacter sp.]|nr:YARHG domain-containing protein [Agathobacter sp.]
MKKRLSLLFIAVVLVLSGCNTNSDTEQEQTEQMSGVDTDAQGDTVDTEGGIVDGQKSSSRISYPGTEYTWNDITVIIPQEWEGKYVIKESKDDLAFFQKVSVEKDETMGWIGSISIRKDYYNDLPGTTLIAYTKDGTFYYLTLPTDVTFFADDEAIASEYMSMMPYCEWIAGSMTSTDTNLCYDGNQYVLLTSSMMPVEDYQIMNMSNNSLWIAKNEIYARHGMVFENAYLDNYFRTCSWYQPIEGKTEVADSELSQIEKDNIKKIIEAENAFAEEHPYPQQCEANYAVHKRLKGGDIPYYVEYWTEEDKYGNYKAILLVDETQYDINEHFNIYLSNPVQDVFYITDIAQDSEDFGGSNDGLEIAILDEGPSDDPVTHFFKYDGTLVYVGEIPGFPFKDYGNGIENKNKRVGLDGFTHQNGIYGTTTTNLIETAYIDAYYWYDKNNWEFKEMEVGLHYYRYNRPHKLYKELPVYYSMSEDAPTILMQPQEEVYFIQTDNKEWIFIRSKDGVEGYIHIEDGQITNIGLPAEEVFSDLWFFG